MQKLFEVVPRRNAWDVCHNHVSFRVCEQKHDAIRLALTLGRLQQRRGDDVEIVLRDRDGRQRARRHLSARPVH